MELIIRIAGYILKDQEEARKGLGDVMGGKVLELESDKLIQEGVKRGLMQGRTQGLEQGIAKNVRTLLHKGKTVEEVADLLDLTVEYVKKIQKEMPKY